MLYYYHLRHWLSQFNLRFGLVGVMPLLLLAAYLIRLRGCSVVLLASGFAASALEMVLLLGFQVICGSLYRQVGVIVTVFMAGLAVGAARPSGKFKIRNPNSIARDRKALALLAFAIAGYALLLPWLLPRLGLIGATGPALAVIKVVISLLAFGLAALVGMQFPLSNRLEYDGTARTASRLYTADFVGASLGALLACTLLIPLTGVTGACWLTAGLNLFAGAVILFRKVVR